MLCVGPPNYAYALFVFEKEPLGRSLFLRRARKILDYSSKRVATKVLILRKSISIFSD